MADRRITFGQKAAERIRDAVIRVERSPYYPDSAGPQRAVPWNPGGVDAIVVNTIGVCSNNSYGTGTAQIVIDNGSGGWTNDTAYPSPVSVNNFSMNSGNINSNTHIGIYWRNGGWRLGWADC